MNAKKISALMFAGLIAASGAAFATESAGNPPKANSAGMGTPAGQKTGEGAGAATGAARPRSTSKARSNSSNVQGVAGTSGAP